MGSSTSQTADVNFTPFLRNLVKEQKRANIGMSKNVQSAYLEQRRLVFVSLTDLIRTYKQCPLELLFSAIFILPLKQEWLLSSNASPATIFGDAHAAICPDRLQLDTFIELLRWKNSQSLLFCMLDEYRSDVHSHHGHLIAPFWLHLSNRFVALGLKALQLVSPDEFQPRFDTKYIHVMAELYCHTMKYKPMQEIMCMSNSQSLHPITAYSPNVFGSKQEFVACSLSSELKKPSVWWISADYELDNEEEEK